jgi:alanine racemase
MNAKMSMNFFCEIAVEEAIRLKEVGVASEVIVMSVGTNQSQEQLRNALVLLVQWLTLALYRIIYRLDRQVKLLHQICIWRLVFLAPYSIWLE